MDEAATASSPVQTYLAQVAELLPRYADLFALLTPQEQARAARYLHSSTREEFGIGRACLRLLLADRLQKQPNAIHFSEGPHGKLQTDGIEFNLSHSHGLIAIAIAQVPVGIDVEWADRKVEVLDVAAAAFVPEEIAALTALSDVTAQRDRFFALWTTQEARSKCLGVGLAGLAAVRSSAALLPVHPLTVPHGYHGAVCVQGVAQVAPPLYLGQKTIENLLPRR